MLGNPLTRRLILTGLIALAITAILSAGVAAQVAVLQAGPVRAGQTVNAAVDQVSDADSIGLGQLIVFLQPATDPVKFGKANGLTYLDSLKSDPNAHIFLAGSQNSAAVAMVNLAASPLVKKVYENRRSQNQLHAFVPNDPYFHRETPAGWTGPGQWHLRNEYNNNMDLGVMSTTPTTGPWTQDITGYGVLIGIVDDSVQRTHPDISPNYVAADSWDFGQADADPYPVYTDDRHGCSTSGVAAARGGNGIGVSGAAPFAKIAGLRIDFPLQTTAMFVDATLYHSSGTNTNIKIKNHSYGVGDPYVNTTAERDAFDTSAGAGTIHVMSAGNDRGYWGQDSNKKMNQANPSVITVAARGSDGKYSSYSCFGANVFCTQMSSSSAGLHRITTTDRTGIRGYNTDSGDTFPDNAYTSLFGGTSSSAPTVAGAIALAKQVRPAMDIRFAKHLIARSSEAIDGSDATETSDGGWRANAVGRWFNQNYGFGKLWSPWLCDNARKYSGVTEQWWAAGDLSVNTDIPDNDATGLSRSFSTPGTIPYPIEEAGIVFHITHPYRGNIQAYITSPSGTTSRLLFRSSSDNGDNIDWYASTNAFWGENGVGVWSVKVVDTAAGNVGKWVSYTPIIHFGDIIEDTDSPGVTVNKTATQPDPAQGNFVYFTVNFSEWVSDFTASDVVLGGTALPTTCVISGGAGRNYTLKVSGMTLHGTVTASIPAGMAHDFNGHANTASTSTDNEVMWNIKPRNLYISPNKGTLNPLAYQIISCAYDDYNGATDILKAYLLLNHQSTIIGKVPPDGANAAYFLYDENLNKMYLRNDANTSWGTGYTPGTVMRPLQNSQIYLDIQGSSVAKSGKNLVVKWNIKPKSTFAESTIYGRVLVQDSGLASPWEKMATYAP